MTREFGLKRVVEPNGSLPVAAWKMNNGRTLAPHEIRVNLKRITFERENFYNLCSSCNYEEPRIKERIIKIVNERGKLHNPYTESSALFAGCVEEIGPEWTGNLKIGDEVVCLSPMAGLPCHIEEIDQIDYNYGEAVCKGYVIGFESTTLVPAGSWIYDENCHMLRALEEEGSLYGISENLSGMDVRRVLIIGSNLAEVIFYSRMVKTTCGEDVHICFAVDNAYDRDFSKEELETIFGELVDEIFSVNLTHPVEAAQILTGYAKEGNFDAVINIENIKGSESVASLAVKNNGLICYTSMNNRYCQGVLIADCLGKDIDHYSLDGYSDSAFAFAQELTEKTRAEFERLDDFYRRNRNRKKENYNVQGFSRERPQIATQQIDGFIYKSKATAEMVEEVLNIAQYDCNVIIQGETGVGKERVFSLIHQNSPRRDKPCIRINCATIQESLAESEFFGYEKGAFTGAQASGKEGYFELANNGTLFLDEIGSLSLVMQSKLLRVLQENTYYRVGGVTPKRVNVRVVCANNIPLKKLVEEGKFREDLYYRLNICLINVPPLRMRKEDIVCLSEAFADNYSRKYGIKKDFSPEALAELVEYHWPGNVRELENTVHRLYIAEKGNVIEGYTAGNLLNHSVFGAADREPEIELGNKEYLDFTKIMDDHERKLIEHALKKKGTTRKAAEYLGIPQTTFARKKLKYNL